MIPTGNQLSAGLSHTLALCWAGSLLLMQKPNPKPERHGIRVSKRKTVANADYLFLLFLALLNAIATACLRGLPAFISRRMLPETIFLDLPRFKGIFIDPLSLTICHTVTI